MKLLPFLRYSVIALLLSAQAPGNALGLDEVSDRLVSESRIAAEDLPPLLSHLITSRMYNDDYVSKWTKPISIVVYGDDTSPLEKDTQILIDNLSAAMSAPIEFIVGQPEQLYDLHLSNPNRIYILYANLMDYPTQPMTTDGSPPDYSDRLLPFTLQGRRDHRLSIALAGFQRAVGAPAPFNCEHWLNNELGEITYFFGFLDAQQDPEGQRECLTVMLLHSLGLTATATETDQSILSLNEAINTITPLDFLALRALYNPSIEPFVPRHQLPSDLEELLP
jgi:hypothetical protein